MTGSDTISYQPLVGLPTDVQTRLREYEASGGSSLIGFMASGAGAVARTMEDKMRETVSAKDFPSVQAAVDTGCDVYFPKGVYTVTSEVVISTEGQRLFGSGARSVIQQSGVNFDVFRVTADDVEFHNLRINGAATSQDASNLRFAILTDETAQPKNLKVIGCRISGATVSEGFRGAIKFNSGCHHGTVEGTTIERLWGSNTDCGYGVLAGNVIGLRVAGNKGFATSGRGRHLVYFSAGASDCNAIFNYAEGFAESALQQFSQGAQIPCYRNLFAYNNIISCSANGTSTSSSLQISGHSCDAKIIGNQIRGSGRNGISVYNFLLPDCSNTEVSGNTVVDSQYYGIFMSGLTGTNILRGNTVRESSRVSAGTYSNIQLESDDITPVALSNVLVQGNHSTGTAFARSPISIVGANIPTGIVIEDNNFPQCVVSKAEISSAILVSGSDAVGVWTPSLRFGGYSSGMSTMVNMGRYIKTGNMVTVSCNIILTSKGWASGLAEIYGLPFTPAAGVGAINLHLNDVVFSGNSQGYMETNLVQLQTISGGVVSNLTDSNFTNNSRVRVTATYFVP